MRSHRRIPIKFKRKTNFMFPQILILYTFIVTRICAFMFSSVYIKKTDHRKNRKKNNFA